MPDDDRLRAELRAYTDASIAGLQKLLDLRVDYDQRALEVAARANDKVLAGMNEVRGVLSDQQTRMISRHEVEQAVGALRAHVDSEVGPLGVQLYDLNRPNWVIIIGLLAFTVSVITGGWLVIGLKIDAANTPLVLSVGVIDVDRAQLAGRVRGIEQQLADGRAARQVTESVARAKVAELETQFKALSDTMNIEKDHVERWLALFYEKANPGARFPPTRFRPNLYRQE